jgi:hypothetical protein
MIRHNLTDSKVAGFCVGILAGAISLIASTIVRWLLGYPIVFT